jgi:ornithine carbamoyltransferase
MSSPRPLPTRVGEVSVTGAKTLLSIANLDEEAFAELLRLTLDFATQPGAYSGMLRNRRVGLLFAKTSTRTRLSFWRAATELGAHTIFLDAGALQTNTGESWADTGRVLGQYLDALVIRTNGLIDEMREIAEGLPATINAMSSCEHPTQALSDYAAIYEAFGRTEGLSLAYLGEGNNTAAAIALLFSRVRGFRCSFYCPAGYGLEERTASIATHFAARSGASIRFFSAVPQCPEPADIVYTTRWQTMGVPHAEENWRATLAPFRVDAALFERFRRPTGSVFMHDLPAVRGDEVSGEVLDGSRSIAIRQSFHKTSGAAGALLWCLARQTAAPPLVDALR